MGDPIYGITENLANEILNKKVSIEDRIKYTKNSRLLLQAQYLEFEFLDLNYKFTSNLKFN